MNPFCGFATHNSRRLVTLGAVARLLGVGTVLTGILLGMLSVRAEIISSDRRVDWASYGVGVPGGIPDRTTIFTNAAAAGCDLTGVNDNSALVQRLINLCPSNSVIYFPAGLYKFTNTVGIGLNRDGITLRGEGIGKTVFIDGCTTARSFFFILGADGPRTEVQVLSGYDKGSTSLTVTDASELNPGELFHIYQSNKVGLVYIDPAAVPNLIRRENRQSETHRIVSRSGNTITIEPPMFIGFEAAYSPRIRPLRGVLEFVGIEDITFTKRHPMTGFDGNNASAVYMNQTYGCWIKNCESALAANRHFYLAAAVVRCEIRDNWIHEAVSYGPNRGPGVEAFSGATSCLIENNAFRLCRPAVWVNNGSCGNVIGYNFSWEVGDLGGGLIFSDFLSNHDPHNTMNLFEGNIGSGYQNDGFHGSSSHTTVFRNHFHGQHPTLVEGRRLISLERWSYFENIVGNVLGSPAQDNWVYDMRTNNYSHRVPVIYRFGYPGAGNNRYSGTNPPSTDVGALDLNVAATVLLHGNFDYSTRSTIWNPGIPDTTLPASLYLSGKPGWWGSGPWPAIGPDLTPMVSKIPAERRFEAFVTGAPQPPRAPRNFKRVE